MEEVISLLGIPTNTEFNRVFLLSMAFIFNFSGFIFFLGKIYDSESTVSARIYS